MWKKRLKIAILSILIFILVFVIYIVSGILISYKKQPDVSKEYIDSFNVSDYISDEVSNERACIIEDNEEALLRRLEMIKKAKKEIILSTFDFKADESGKAVIAYLIEAADRDVEVKIIVDGFSSFVHMNGDKYFYALSQTDNVEIKIYNKANALTPWKSMGRLHDKYLIVDGEVYILGGRNTYDYFLGDNGYKNYDRDVLVYNSNPKEDSSVNQVKAYFDEVWNLDVSTSYRDKSISVSSKDVESAREELKEFFDKTEADNLIKEDVNYEDITFETNKIMLLKNPTHVYAKEPDVFYSLVELMENLEGDVYIHTPYIICNDYMYKSFKDICDSDKKVTLMTNSVANNGNSFGAADYSDNKDKLIDTGMKILEYEGGISYHGKSLTVGDNISIVGSFNMDMRSAYLDTELMIVIDSKDVNKQLRENMKEYEDNAAIVLSDDKYEIPDGVKQQEISDKRKKRMDLISHFMWFRFLM